MSQEEELNIGDISAAADLLVKGTAEQNSSPVRGKVWGQDKPERRVEISTEEIAAMGDILAGKFEEPKVTVATSVEPGDPIVYVKAAPSEEQVSIPKLGAGIPDFRPSTPEEAKAGLGGYKLDNGKPRWELAPFDAFEAMIAVQTWAVNKNVRGEKAYPERNWERGMAWSRCFGAMMRHAWKWWQGKMFGGSTVDEESGLSHAWHFFTCAGFLVAYELRDMKEFDDRPVDVAEKNK